MIRLVGRDVLIDYEAFVMTSSITLSTRLTHADNSSSVVFCRNPHESPQKKGIPHENE